MTEQTVSRCECGEHCWLVAGDRYVVFVSPEDQALVSQCRWGISRKLGKTRLSHLRVLGQIKKRRVALGRLLLDVPDDLVADHIDGDSLNNRRGNLRICTATDNARNRHGAVSKVGFKGVHNTWGRSDRYKALIWLDGGNRHLGTFDNPVDAAKAYDRAALQHYGEYASLNFPKDAA